MLHERNEQQYGFEYDIELLLDSDGKHFTLKEPALPLQTKEKEQ
jgi:hypothetical protein